MFIVTVNSFDELKSLEQAQADGIILPVPHFSIRQNAFLDLDSLKEVTLRLKNQNIKVYFNLLKMLTQSDLEQAEKLLIMAKELDVDGLYIADEGWLEMAGQLNLIDRLIYQPETLIVNGMDADFYADLGLQAVSLAHELSIDEIEAIAADSHASLEVLIQGRYSWMYSRRKLITNYFDAIDLQEPVIDNKAYDLQEATREGVMKIVENEAGTHVFADEPIASFSVMERLKKAGIQRFRIDTMFEDAAKGAACLHLYRQALNGRLPEDTEQYGSDSLYFSQTIKKKEKTNGQN